MMKKGPSGCKICAYDCEREVVRIKKVGVCKKESYLQLRVMEDPVSEKCIDSAC